MWVAIVRLRSWIGTEVERWLGKLYVWVGLLLLLDIDWVEVLGRVGKTLLWSVIMFRGDEVLAVAKIDFGSLVGSEEEKKGSVQVKKFVRLGDMNFAVFVLSGIFE